MDKQISGLLEIFAILPGWWIFPVAGLVAGVLAGCFGIGGGLVVVPVLAWVYLGMEVAEPVRMHLAIGTSLATIVPTSLSSIYAHHRRGAVL
ncbi:MAG: sulfite exporter TauE/SafE family protein, partial [Gammaproteobacteria bacterium]|nr:sulfite exporter TauE/SafE family protein [Gammaproteobacteria bacterium]